MKPRLIVLSDLWGFENADWIEEYKKLLSTHFALTFYDSCKLAQIQEQGLSEGEKHERFLKFGISTAVERLMSLEQNEIYVLAFSIGGTIAWKAGTIGLKINTLHAISATRIRYEKCKPEGDIHIIFGENDAFRPNNPWAKKMGLKVEIKQDGKHEIYKESKFIESLCKSMSTPLGTVS